MSRCLRVTAAAGLLSSLPALLPAASFPPHFRFRTISTARVHVHYHQGLEPMAREAAALAGQLLSAHERRYGTKVSRVHIVLADVEDSPNGFATPVPYPIVQVRAVPPDGGDDFGNYEGWLRLVLSHELAHIVHLEQAGGIFGAARKAFGRNPLLFPNAATPDWMVEGLATYEETEMTAFGRGRNPDSRMVLRMAALEDDFPAEDRPALGLDRWPGGQGAYLFGEAFLRDLTRRFGDPTIPDLARVHSRYPTLDDLTARKVTGASFHTRWKEWAREARLEFEREARELERQGLTASRPLTRRGIRQVGPRFGPDGTWIAYTSRTLTRFRAIRLVRPDGTDDRSLADRNGGGSLSWTPDGKAIVYDEPEVHRFFATRSDLRVVDMARGKVRRLTRGLRARHPDVSPDGRSVVFVRQQGDRGELAVIGLDGSGLRDLTRSEAGTQWSGPRWGPNGDVLVASRWTAGGWLDIVTVDAVSGAVTERTHDRAKDVEPAWTPGGRHVIFRSDRDGVSNLYALRLEDNLVLRVTSVLGGAFSPDVSPQGGLLAFSSYSARGYDVHVMDLDLAALRPAAPFRDPYPPSLPAVKAATEPDRAYRPFPALRPRFWSPFLASASGEVQYGAVTGGADPLLRHAYGLDLHLGSDTGRLSLQGFYQYDRFRPTFLVVYEDESEPAEENGLFRTRKLTLRGSMPLRRSVRSSQSLSLAWRRSRETLEDPREPERLDLGGLEAAWSMSTVKRYPYSISPLDGSRLRLAALKEDPAFGSDLSLVKTVADARSYLRLFKETDALALRAGGGATWGRPSFRRSFAVGGFPDGSLFDLVRTNHSLLRGYPGKAFTGRRFIHANAEYRFALAHPQRGFRSLPFFLRHLHGAVFVDAGHAWSGAFRLHDVKTSAGAVLGADTHLGRALPLTLSLGLARGFADKGETQVYFRTGLAF